MSATSVRRRSILAKAGSDSSCGRKPAWNVTNFCPSLCRESRRRADVFAILLPSRVRRDAARQPNAFERRIILADAAKHGGDNNNFVLPKHLFGLLPAAG